MLLRLFGARIGKGVVIRPSVRITYPWKLSIGDHAWIGDRVELYTLGPIDIGANAVVSQDCYLCTGTHDRRDPTFAILASPITIGEEAWLASGVFVAPGVTVGRGAVVGARSLLLRDAPEGMVLAGHPAVVKGPRLPADSPALPAAQRTEA
jgi:putative colanic acid biosynthesis acetyltransferase WcaF